MIPNIFSLHTLCTSHFFCSFRILMSSWLYHLFSHLSQISIITLLWYEMNATKISRTTAINTLRLLFASLNLNPSVSCPNTKHSCSLAAAFSSIHLPSQYDLKSSFLLVLHTKHTCLDVDSLHRVKAVSELKKGNVLAQMRATAAILVLCMGKITKPKGDISYSSKIFFAICISQIASI